MIKVLLLNPPYKKFFSRSSRSAAVAKSGTLYYPIFLSYLAAFLKKFNYSIKLLDSIADNLNFDQTVDLIKEFNPDFIICDTSIPSGKNDVILLNKIKNIFCDCFCVLVGPYPTSYADEIQKMELEIDAFVKKEYEYAIFDLIKKRKQTNLKNIFINDNYKWRFGENEPEIADLNNIEFVSKIYAEHLDIKKYFYSSTQYPVLTILSSRGCPFKCGFCNLPHNFYLKNFRQRTSENLFNEFEYIKYHLPFVKEIFIEDDSFNVNLNFVKEFCRKKINAKNRVKWSINFSPKNFDEETIYLLKKANCRLIVIGYETWNNENLQIYKNGLTTKKYFELSFLLRKYKIKTHGCFIFGFPGDTKKNAIKNINLACRLKPDTAQFFPLMLNKNTPLFNLYLKNKWLLNEDSDYNTENGLHNSNISLPGFSQKEIMEFCSIARKKFYLRFEYIVSKFIQISTSLFELKRTFRSLKIFYKYLF